MRNLKILSEMKISTSDVDLIHFGVVISGYSGRLAETV